MIKSLRTYSIFGVLYPFLFSAYGNVPLHLAETDQDSTFLKQQIQNGRVWEKKYDRISGHEFFLTQALCESRVTAGRRVFENQLLRYDIFNDEAVLMVRPDLFIVMNRENVSEFTINCLGRDYRFVNFGEMGYCQVLYDGKSMLVRKHIKTIRKDPANNLYDTFTEETSDFVVLNGTFHRIRNRQDFFRALAGKEKEIREYIRRNALRPDVKRTESLITVLQYYETL